MAKHEYNTKVGELFFNSIRAQSTDVFVIVIYAVVIGLLYLVVPLAVQELVNIIAFGLVQTLFILSALMIGILLLVGLLQVLQRYVIEIIQQRLFVNHSFRLVEQIIHAQKDALTGKNINLFFEVLNLQKSFSKLLADGLAALLQTVAGFILLGFYHPWFLGLNIFLLLFAFFAIFFGGRGGMKSSLIESEQKYNLIHWLQDLGSSQEAFQLMSDRQYVLNKTDKIDSAYLKARFQHFKVLMRQRVATFLVYIATNGGLLTIGGLLVIQGQLTLGQLIAAELVVNSILVGLDKFVSQLDVVFDLLTALVKLDYLHSLPCKVEMGQKTLNETIQLGLKLECSNVHFVYTYENGEKREILKGINLNVDPGEWAFVLGESGSGKSSLLSVLAGLYNPSKGAIYLDETEMNELKLSTFGQAISLARGGSQLIFEGTVAENILLGREEKVPLRRILQLVALEEEVNGLPQGINTVVESKGLNLSESQIVRILLARALVSHPRLLLIDYRPFMTLEENVRQKIFFDISDKFDFRPTIIFFGNRDAILDSGLIQKNYLLYDGQLFESPQTRS